MFNTDLCANYTINHQNNCFSSAPQEIETNLPHFKQESITSYQISQKKDAADQLIKSKMQLDHDMDRLQMRLSLAKNQTQKQSLKKDNSKDSKENHFEAKEVKDGEQKKKFADCLNSKQILLETKQKNKTKVDQILRNQNQIEKQDIPNRILKEISLESKQNREKVTETKQEANNLFIPPQQFKAPFQQWQDLWNQELSFNQQLMSEQISYQPFLSTKANSLKDKEQKQQINCSRKKEKKEMKTDKKVLLENKKQFLNKHNINDNRKDYSSYQQQKRSNSLHLQDRSQLLRLSPQKQNDTIDLKKRAQSLNGQSLFPNKQQNKIPQQNQQTNSLKYKPSQRNQSVGDCNHTFQSQIDNSFSKTENSVYIKTDNPFDSFNDQFNIFGDKSENVQSQNIKKLNKNEVLLKENKDDKAKNIICKENEKLKSKNQSFKKPEEIKVLSLKVDSIEVILPKGGSKSSKNEQVNSYFLKRGSVDCNNKVQTSNKGQGFIQLGFEEEIGNLSEIIQKQREQERQLLAVVNELQIIIEQKDSLINGLQKEIQDINQFNLSGSFLKRKDTNDIDQQQYLSQLQSKDNQIFQLQQQIANSSSTIQQQFIVIANKEQEFESVNQEIVSLKKQLFQLEQQNNEKDSINKYSQNNNGNQNRISENETLKKQGAIILEQKEIILKLREQNEDLLGKILILEQQFQAKEIKISDIFVFEADLKQRKQIFEERELALYQRIEAQNQRIQQYEEKVKLFKSEKEGIMLKLMESQTRASKQEIYQRELEELRKGVVEFEQEVENMKKAFQQTLKEEKMKVISYYEQKIEFDRKSNLLSTPQESLLAKSRLFNEQNQRNIQNSQYGSDIIINSNSNNDQQIVSNEKILNKENQFNEQIIANHQKINYKNYQRFSPKNQENFNVYLFEDRIRQSTPLQNSQKLQNKFGKEGDAKIKVPFEQTPDNFKNCLQLDETQNLTKEKKESTFSFQDYLNQHTGEQMDNIVKNDISNHQEIILRVDELISDYQEKKSNCQVKYQNFLMYFISPQSSDRNQKSESKEKSGNEISEQIWEQISLLQNIKKQFLDTCSQIELKLSSSQNSSTNQQFEDLEDRQVQIMINNQDITNKIKLFQSLLIQK